MQFCIVNLIDAYEDQRALVFHPDDLLFAQFRRRMETERDTLARRPKPGRTQRTRPLWLQEQLPPRAGIVPLSSNVLAPRYDTLGPSSSPALY